MSSEQEKTGTKVLKGCGKESRLLSVAATVIAAKATEVFGVDVGPQEITVLGLALFSLAQRLENHLGR